MKSRSRNDSQWKGISESVEDLGRFLCFWCNDTLRPASLGNVGEGDGGGGGVLRSQVTKTKNHEAPP